MTMWTLRFKRGDIVQSIPPYSTGVYVITEVTPSRPKNAYTAVNAVTGKRYKLSDESLRKIGVADDSYLNGDDGDTTVTAGNDIAYIAGQQRATTEVLRCYGDAASKARWQLLANAKPGDMIRTYYGNLKFVHVLTRGHKYVFLAQNENGKFFKYPLGYIVVDGVSAHHNNRPLEEML